MNTQQTSARKQGFTLVELMVVISIMALLLTASVAAFNSILQSKGVDGARNTIKGVLSTARMRAVRDKRPVTALLSVDGAIDWGFVVNNDYPARQTVVITRLLNPDETLWSDIPNSSPPRKNWTNNQFQTVQGGNAFYAYVVSGPAAGNIAEIGSNQNWYFVVNPNWRQAPSNGSVVCILRTTSKTPPLIDHFSITPDMASGEWKALSKFVIVDGADFPITFRPDGSAIFAEPRDFGRIRLRDSRTDHTWTWRLIIDRGTGRISESQIERGHADSEI